MAPVYSGILGVIAFVTMICRGILWESDLHETVTSSVKSLIIFMVIGYIVGILAEWTLNDSNRLTVMEKIIEENEKNEKLAALKSIVKKT